MTLVLKILSLVRLAALVAVLAGALTLLGGIFLVLHVSRDLPKLPAPLSRIIETPQSRIYAATGQVVMTLGERKAVPLAMVSKDFIHAIVATEDHRFFQHHGINKLRILKALYITLLKPGRVQGASTITQQLAKNLFFSFEQSWQRKFKEMLVAFQIEAANTKAQILNAYINQIHFGAGAQGVEKAAQTFFGISALDLDLPRAAFLAGLPKSPTRYNPFIHYDRALKRRDVVLARMQAAGFITADQAGEAAATRPQLRPAARGGRGGSYFLDALIRDLVSRYGEDVVFHGGIQVYSTLDIACQTLGERWSNRDLTGWTP